MMVRLKRFVDRIKKLNWQGLRLPTCAVKPLAECELSTGDSDIDQKDKMNMAQF